MTGLLRPDLNQIPLDVDSFLGRAIALGRQYGKLPERFLDALMVFLRTRGLAYAQRHRTGIRIGREELARGIKQAVTCVDLALEEEAGGDLNAAVETLVHGDFEALRQRGWELAFGRLEEMRERSAILCQRQEAKFLQELLPQVHPWTRIVPETWTGVDAEGEAVPVDPREDYAAFGQLEGRLAFLHSLPRERLRELLAAVPQGGTFASLLQRLLLALALDQESLVADGEQVRRFQEECFAGGRMRPEVRQKVLSQLAAHLEGALESRDIRAAILDDVEEEIGLLEGCAAEDMVALFTSLPEAFDVDEARKAAEADEEARRAATADMGADIDILEAWEMKELDEEVG